MTREEKVLIHEALHSDAQTVDLPQKAKVIIKVASNGCRFIAVGCETYMVQNPLKSSQYAAMARLGAQITWILRTGQWGLIMNGKVQRD